MLNVPVTLAPGILVNPEPDPVNDEPVTAPLREALVPVITPPLTEAAVTPPDTDALAPLTAPLTLALEPVMTPPTVLAAV